MNEHPSLDRTKEQQETEETLRELIREFQPVAESRRQLRETEQELRGLLVAVSAKLDSLGEMKKANLELEREVLTRIRAML